MDTRISINFRQDKHKENYNKAYYKPTAKQTNTQ